MSGGSGYSFRARRLERIAAGLDLAVDIASFAGDRRGVFEPFVIGLKLGVSDAPILDRHVIGDEFLAVSLLVIGADLEFHVGPAPGMTAPVHAGTADHLTRQERAEATHRQCLLRGIVAHGEGVARGILHQVMAHDIAQFVANVGQRIVVRAGARCAALECDHLQAGFRQFLGENAAVQPSPTMTTSTSLSLVVMACPLTHIRDADGFVRKRLAAKFLHVIAMHRDHAGEANDGPARFVAVTAIDRI